MDGGDLTREQVVPLLGTTDAALQKAVFSVIASTPDWAGAVAGLLRRVGRRAATWTSPARRRCARRCSAFATNPEIQDLVARALLQRGDSPLRPGCS